MKRHSLIKYLIKQIFCRHEYKQEYRVTGRNIEHDKEVIFEVGYGCTKCNKKLIVNMDKECQLGLVDKL